MNLIAIDFEFNQYFAFPGYWRKNEPRCPAEIIQIGAARLNADLEITETRSFFIKPQIYPRMHPHIKRLTKLDVGELKKSPKFPEVFERFAEFANAFDDAVFCVWGSDDMTELFRNLLYYNIDAGAISKNYINAQKIANTYLQNPNSSIGLKDAAQRLEIDTPRPFHDALADAVYTAEIFRKIAEKTREAGEDFWGGAAVRTVDLRYVKDVLAAKANDVNITSLYSYSRKKLGRELDDETRNLVLSVYTAGRIGKFDSKKEQLAKPAPNELPNEL